MAGLHDTEIKLDGSWQIAKSASGDSSVITGLDCLVQDIQLEAATQEGELFYDEKWGWSLLEFMHREDDEFTRLEINQRITDKLSRRPEVDIDSINIEIGFKEDSIEVLAAFKFLNDEKINVINIDLNRIRVEVIIA